MWRIVYPAKREIVVTHFVIIAERYLHNRSFNSQVALAPGLRMIIGFVLAA
jgi:hypothetical protein